MTQVSKTTNGFLKRYRWLIARRFCQLSILGLFWLGSAWGFWLLSGNLSASRLLSVIPLNEPFAFVQSFLSGYTPALKAWIGVLVVISLYMVLSGRTFCAWVCPVNLVTDLAAWCRNTFNIKNQLALSNHLRHYFLIAILLLTFITGNYFYASIDPVQAAQRALIFMMWAGVWPLILIFCLDTFVSKRAWCSHLCPMGAFYRVLNLKVIPWRLRVLAPRRSQCDFCMDCVKVCPEPRIIMPVLKEATPAIIQANDCTNCGRCVEICHEDVFELKFTTPKKLQALSVTARPHKLEKTPIKST